MFNENLLFFKMSTIIFYYSPQPLCYIAINGMQHILGCFFLKLCIVISSKSLVALNFLFSFCNFVRALLFWIAKVDIWRSFFTILQMVFSLT